MAAPPPPIDVHHAVRLRGTFFLFDSFLRTSNTQNTTKRPRVETEPGKYARFGGSVPNLDLSDPLEFSIGLKEAQYLDPSLRLALEVAHQVRNSLIIHLSGVDMRP